MPLPLEPRTRIGFMATVASRGAARRTAELADRLGYDSIWVGDHLAFPVPMLDPLLQLAQLGAFSERVTLGTAVYLLPLRHPTSVAKQVATLDHLTGGRLIFGVGLGGEFPAEFAAAGVSVHERGARLSEGIDVLRALWTGEAVSHQGRFWSFPEVRMLPHPVQPGGPPIWGGGRADAALERMGRKADGWISYAVTPERYREGLTKIAKGAQEVGREIERFGTGHLLFTWIDSSHERALEIASAHLSERYAMDFRRAAQRYGALGQPEDVAERIHALREAGVRDFALDLSGPNAERDLQLERFAAEVRPLLG